MITFSNPLLLWLFPALLLPWIFRRRKEERIRHIPFPLLKFLQESKERELVNPHLQEFLLLLLRTLLIAVLLMALAGPKWVTESKKPGGWLSFLPFGSAFQANTVVLDSSYSMGYGEGNDAWWRKAQLHWNSVNASLRGFSTHRYRWDSSTVIPNNPTPLRSYSEQEIEELFLGIPTEEGTSIPDLCNALKKTNENQGSVILVTDGQRWPWEKLLEISLNPSDFPPLLVLLTGSGPVNNTWFQVESLSSPPWGISGWETLSGHIFSISGKTGGTGIISIFQGKTGKHLYSKTVTYPTVQNKAALLPFSFTAMLSKLIEETDVLKTGKDLEFTITLEPSDPLPIDNTQKFRVPMATKFTFGLACNPQLSNQALSVITTAINPLMNTKDTPPVESRIVQPPFDSVAGDVDLLLLVQDFAPWWSNRETMAAINYLKNGGSAVVFAGENKEANSPWNQFLNQLGWAWTVKDTTGEITKPVTITGSGILPSALSAWDATMWNTWIPKASPGAANNPDSHPLVSYAYEDSVSHLITEIKVGKGRCWLINSSLNEKSQTLLSPILPVFLWEAGKEVARAKQSAEIQLPKPKLESNLILLSDADKEALQKKYNIRFTNLDGMDKEIARLNNGFDLRTALLLLCLILALAESWLSNRLAAI